MQLVGLLAAVVGLLTAFFAGSQKATSGTQELIVVGLAASGAIGGFLIVFTLLQGRSSVNNRRIIAAVLWVAVATLSAVGIWKRSDRLDRVGLMTTECEHPGARARHEATQATAASTSSCSSPCSCRVPGRHRVGADAVGHGGCGSRQEKARARPTAFWDAAPVGHSDSRAHPRSAQSDGLGGQWDVNCLTPGLTWCPGGGRAHGPAGVEAATMGPGPRKRADCHVPGALRAAYRDPPLLEGDAATARTRG